MLGEINSVIKRWIRKLTDPNKDRDYDPVGPYRGAIFCFFGSAIIVHFAWYAVKRRVDIDEQYKKLASELAVVFLWDIIIPTVFALFISLAFSTGAKNKTGRQMFFTGAFGALSIVGILTILATYLS